jgi:hypothetical protein
MKKYSFIVLYFIVLQASAQNSALLKGSFSAAKETEIRLMGFLGISFRGFYRIRS